jgi:hypothetical protein
LRHFAGTVAKGCAANLSKALPNAAFASSSFAELLHHDGFGIGRVTARL